MASAWEIKGIPTYKPLKEDITSEVCIVGGGLAGIWSAYLLSKAGKHVVVLEADKLGRAATLYTTAFLTQSIDTDLADLISALGKSNAKKIIEVHGKAIDLIEETLREEGIECEFKRVDNRIIAQSEKDLEELKAEYDLAKSLGFDVEWSTSPFKGFQNLGGLIWHNQGKYHPMKFFKGLVEAAEKYGAEIYEKTEVTDIKGRSIFTIETKSGKTVKAKYVIVATYDPFNNPKPVHWKKGMYESYVYNLKVKKGSIPEGIYEDNANPYHYFRIDRGEKEDYMIVGGEDHRTELVKALTSKSFKALKEWVDETFPGLDYTVEEKWHGGILEPSDGLALIGEYAPRQFLASAFSGNGMTYSAISGMILADLIKGKKNVYAPLFDPTRKLNEKLLGKKFRDYGEEFFKGAGKNLFA